MVVQAAKAAADASTAKDLTKFDIFNTPLSHVSHQMNICNDG
jgi:hypothetical protein